MEKKEEKKVGNPGLVDNTENLKDFLANLVGKELKAILRDLIPRPKPQERRDSISLAELLSTL